jgi:hypothetical protein
LPYNQLNSSYVQNPISPQSQTADLSSYLGTSLRAAEIQADLAIGNKKVAGQDYSTTEQFQQQIQQSGQSWCSQHPEACGSDSSSVISGLVDQYKTFVGTATDRYNSEIQGSQGGYTNPTGITPVGTPIQTKDPITGQSVWLTPNQIAAQTPAPAATAVVPDRTSTLRAPLVPSGGTTARM